MDYWPFLTLTIAIELAVGTIYLFLVKSRGYSSPLLAILSVNLVSHPLAWSIYHQQNGGYWWIELAVVGFEAAMISTILRRQIAWAALMSLVINTCSAAAGWMII